MAAPDAMAGVSAGNVTVSSTRAGEAPSTRAASPSRGSRRAHMPPTVRTITE